MQKYWNCIGLKHSPGVLDLPLSLGLVFQLDVIILYSCMYEGGAPKWVIADQLYDQPLLITTTVYTTSHIGTQTIKDSTKDPWTCIGFVNPF
jgi:hypothetical protein